MVSSTPAKTPNRDFSKKHELPKLHWFARALRKRSTTGFVFVLLMGWTMAAGAGARRELAVVSGKGRNLRPYLYPK